MSQTTGLALRFREHFIRNDNLTQRKLILDFARKVQGNQELTTWAFLFYKDLHMSSEWTFTIPDIDWSVFASSAINSKDTNSVLLSLFGLESLPSVPELTPTSLAHVFKAYLLRRNPGGRWIALDFCKSMGQLFNVDPLVALAESLQKHHVEDPSVAPQWNALSAVCGQSQCVRDIVRGLVWAEQISNPLHLSPNTSFLFPPSPYRTAFQCPSAPPPLVATTFAGAFNATHSSAKAFDGLVSFS
jgi:hypothetical protein